MIEIKNSFVQKLLMMKIIKIISKGWKSNIPSMTMFEYKQQELNFRSFIKDTRLQELVNIKS